MCTQGAETEGLVGEGSLMAGRRGCRGELGSEHTCRGSRPVRLEAGRASAPRIACMRCLSEQQAGGYQGRLSRRRVQGGSPQGRGGRGAREPRRSVRREASAREEAHILLFEPRRCNTEYSMVPCDWKRDCGGCSPEVKLAATYRHSTKDGKALSCTRDAHAHAHRAA